DSGGERAAYTNNDGSLPVDPALSRSKDNAGATTVAFEPTSYTLPVLSQAKLTVRVTPPSDRLVTFALVGETLDASLEFEQVAVDASGIASVNLSTASEPTTFSVRASLDRSLVAEAIVKVERNLTSSVQISTKYGGRRKVENYSIALYPGKDCTSSGLDDVAQTHISFSSPTMPTSIPNVPLSKSLAVVVDGDEVVHGCVTARPSSAVAALMVEVPIEDLPMNLTGVVLNVALTQTEGAAKLNERLSSAIPDYVDLFVPGQNDVQQLLYSMESVATGSLKQEFTALRSASSWDQVASETYGEAGRDVLRSALRGWLTNGLQALTPQPIVASLSLGSDATATPKLYPLVLSGFDAASLNMKSTDLAVDIAANDQLNWSGKLSVSKTDYLGAVALKAARVEDPETASIAGQLAKRVDCETFATLLEEKSVWQQSNARTCAQSCLATLCRSALEALARTATESTSLGAFELLINASGTANVDTHARPTTVSGSWVGAFLGASSADSFKGTYESR
ncbi:MAG TPA: hypothetical protein VKP30_06155, partial [Polyangiaceae bacterium]|nr:hypothetical protein [Polyangiaceae bacterium]